MCKLKNGSIVSVQIVHDTLIKLNELASGVWGSSDPDVILNSICELRKKADNPNYYVNDLISVNILKEYMLLDNYGRISEDIKNIVLSTIQITGQYPTIHDPIVDTIGNGGYENTTFFN